MAATRIVDIYNAKIGSTQVLGAESFEVDEQYDEVASHSDGLAGEAAVDHTTYGATGTLTAQDIASFGTLVGLWEQFDSLAVLAEGKLQGDIANGRKLTLNRAKLAGASLSLMPGQHARTTFRLMNSALPASVTPEEEVVSAALAKSLTFSSNYRGVQILTATFTPSVGADIIPLGLTGLELEVSYETPTAAGDGDFGRVCESCGGKVRGTLHFQDETLITGRTVAQALAFAPHGTLVVTYSQESGQASKTLTLANLTFAGDRHERAATRFGAMRLPFRQFFRLGANAYGFGYGTYKLFVVT